MVPPGGKGLSPLGVRGDHTPWGRAAMPDEHGASVIHNCQNPHLAKKPIWKLWERTWTLPRSKNWQTPGPDLSGINSERALLAHAEQLQALAEIGRQRTMSLDALLAAPHWVWHLQR